MTAARLAQFDSTLLYRLQDMARPFSVGSYIEANQTSFKAVYSALLRLEAKGLVRRTGGEQSVRIGGKDQMFPMWEAAVVKSELPESLASYQPKGVDVDQVMIDEAIEMYGLHFYPEAI
jgi:hypothetical protein